MEEGSLEIWETSRPRWKFEDRQRSINGANGEW